MSDAMIDRGSMSAWSLLPCCVCLGTPSVLALPTRISGCAVWCVTCNRSAVGTFSTAAGDWNAMNDGTKVTSALLDDLERVL